MTAHDNTTVPTAAGDETIVDIRREVKRCSECAQRFGADARFCPFDGTELQVASWDPSEDSLLGAVVGERYEVCAVLGEGGMGTVYKVRHVALGRMFAMKVLRRDLARDADLAKRFTQEALATASIKHPNVVQINDFGRLAASGAPYFVMELLIGQPLSAALESRGPLPIDVACRIVLKIAEGLAAAHEAGIVHRDLKPENVFLVGRAGDAGTPEDARIVDFGAAKVMGSSRVTKTGIVFGTPHFMSPEQASGETLDHRTDIYSLGVIMYELFTGRLPFEADTYMGVLTQHMFAEPAAPSAVSPHGRELGPLEAIVLRALEKKPEARYASMEELADAVRLAVRGAPDGRPERIPLRSSHPAPSTAYARPTPYASDERDARRESDRTGIAREKPPRWLMVVAAAALLVVVGSALLVALRRPAPAPPEYASPLPSILAPSTSASISASVAPPSGTADAPGIASIVPSVAPPTSAPLAPDTVPSAGASPGAPVRPVARGTVLTPAGQPGQNGAARAPRDPRPSTGKGPDGDFVDPWKKGRP